MNSLIVCLSVCLLVLCKFSNFFVDYKAAGVRKNVVRMNTDVSARRWAVDGGGGGGWQIGVGAGCWAGY